MVSNSPMKESRLTTNVPPSDMAVQVLRGYFVFCQQICPYCENRKAKLWAFGITLTKRLRLDCCCCSPTCELCSLATETTTVEPAVSLRHEPPAQPCAEGPWVKHRGFGRWDGVGILPDPKATDLSRGWVWHWTLGWLVLFVLPLGIPYCVRYLYFCLFQSESNLNWAFCKGRCSEWCREGLKGGQFPGLSTAALAQITPSGGLMLRVLSCVFLAYWWL